MQIAQIVPNVRTQKEGIFDYAIPPEILPQIKPGVLVEIPFHGRKLPGIVIKLSRASRVQKKLKKIVKIINPLPTVDTIHINLAQWMSEYYLAPLGKTLFENVIPPAKRTFDKIILENNNSFFPTEEKKVDKTHMRKSKKYLIMAGFQQRIKFYIQAVEKTIAQNKQAIIIVPDLSNIPFFTKHLKKPYSILHSDLTITQRFLQWNKIRQGKTKIIIGSLSAIFAPTPNLGLIIIDQEENQTYKNDRTPRFNMTEVANKLSGLAKADLVLGSITPSIEIYNQALKNIYSLKKRSEKINKDISIIDMNYEKQIVSIPLQEKIEKSLAQKKKTVLVLNSKGEGKKFACADCSWVFRCPKCDLPLIPQENQGFCFRCQKTLALPAQCPQCHNTQLKSFGLGIRKLEKFINNFWPDAKTIIIEEKKQKHLPNLKDTLWDIALTTSYGLKLRFPQIDLVGIINADQSLNFPDFKSSEKNFQTLYKFLKIGASGIIQTNSPENPIISALAQLNYEKFFLEEITLRKKYKFPPFVQLTRLLYKDYSEENAQEKTQKIYDLIATIKKEGKLDIVEILGPVPAFYKKKRNYFYWQIVIKISKPHTINTILPLKNLLKTLDKNWIIDVDPINLL